MINRIISGVCECIAKEFGDKYPIYTDKVTQGFNDACFFVSALTAGMDPIITRDIGKTGRYNFSVVINVIYSPQNGDEDREDMYKKLVTLLDILEYIEVDGLTRGKEISGDILFDAAGMYLAVNATYEFTVYKNGNTEQNFMEDLKQNYTEKGIDRR